MELDFKKGINNFKPKFVENRESIHGVEGIDQVIGIKDGEIRGQ